jgi:hypothetical protein
VRELEVGANRIAAAYLAQQSKHDRQLAITVLRPE